MRCSHRPRPRWRQVQVLQVAGRIGDKSGHAASVDVFDAQLAACGGVFDPHNHPGPGREGVQPDGRPRRVVLFPADR